MKSKTSPTSPKNHFHQKQEINDLYAENLQTISKPSSKKSSTSLGLLLLVIVISFLSGFLVQLLIIAYGADLPWLNKILSANSFTQYVITPIKKGDQAVGQDAWQKLIASVSPSVVMVYDTPASSENLSSSFYPDEARGNGFVLTDDGYIITTQEIASSAESLTVVVQSGQYYKVEAVVIDPATKLAFLKIPAAGLSTVAVNNATDLTQNEELLAIKLLSARESPVTAMTNIATIDYHPAIKINSLSKTTDEYDHALLLAERLSPRFNSGLVFNVRNEAVGINAQDDFGDTVMPFGYILNVLDDLLGKNKVIRPYLGGQYIDLSTAIGLPASFSSDQSQGALLYSDDEAKNPTILPGSPGQKAGLKKGDIIKAVDNQLIDKQHLLEDEILKHKPGEEINLTVLRNNQELTIRVILEENNDHS